jgi:hypothetical protein
VSSALDVDGPFGRFADRLLRIELPQLPPRRLAETVAFVSRRARATPGPLRSGVVALALGVQLSERFVDPGATTQFLRRTTLPFVGELARMVRSLAFAYVWESWPDTAPDGASPHCPSPDVAAEPPR